MNYSQTKFNWNFLFFVLLIIFKGLIMGGIFGIFCYFFGNSWKFWIILLSLHVILLFFVALNLHFSNFFGDYKFFWLTATISLPIFGAIIYFSFGRIRLLNSQNSFPRKIDQKFIYTVKKYQNQNWSNYPKIPIRISNLFRYAQAITRQNSWPNTKFNLFIDPFNKFSQLRIDFMNAKKYIYLNYYIIQEGDCFNFIYEILAEKIKKGVKVKIIYDFIGMVLNPVPELLKKLKKMGAQIEINGSFFPFNIKWIYRSHRKDVIIDGKIGYTGGYNIGDEYCHMSDYYGFWRDIHLRLEGPATRHIELIFRKDWAICQSKKITKPLAEFPKIIHQNFTKINNLTHLIGDFYPNKNSLTRNMIIEAINTANKKIWIMSPFILIDEEIINNLIRSAQKKIDLRIILTNISSAWFVNVMRLRFQEMIDAGIKIYEFNGYAHSKMILIDDGLILTGTTNLDFFSFFLSKQTLLLIYDKQLSATISKNAFEKDFQLADLLTVSPLVKKSKWQIWKLKLISIIKAFG